MISPLRGLLALVLGLVACVLLPLTLVAAWADDLVSDTDHYVTTVAPLADDPALQKLAADRLSAGVLDNLDPRVEALLGPDVRPTVRQLADAAVRSDAFDDVWLTANETAHERLLTALQGDGPAKDVVIPLSPLVDAVVKDLAPAGVKLDLQVPPDTVAVTLLPASRVDDARVSYQRLVAADAWLPWATVGTVLLTLLVAVRRVRALAWLGAGCALGALAVPFGLDLVRRTAVATAAGTAPASVRYAVWDALVEPLKHRGFVAAGIAALVMVVAALASLVVRRRG